jgi:hypothetical protein
LRCRGERRVYLAVRPERGVRLAEYYLAAGDALDMSELLNGVVVKA